jgi:hypothetical protein
MVEMSKRPRRLNQGASNEEVHLPLLVLCLLLFFPWFLYLFSISCVVGLLRLSDMLVLLPLVLYLYFCSVCFLPLVLAFILDLVCCRTNETVGYARPCSGNYLVELLQLLVCASLRLSSHRPFTRSALTVSKSYSE